VLSAVNLAVVHGLPPAGGCFRVLAEYVSRTRAQQVTIYTRRHEVGGQIELDGRAEVERLAPLPAAPRGRTRRRLLRRLPALGAEMAAEIDRAGHDVALCFDTDTIHSAEALPFLRTPSVYYAAEPERKILEPDPGWATPRTLAYRLYVRGIGPTATLQRDLYRRNLMAADRVVTLSRHSAKAFERAYGVRSTVVYPGVDGERFSPDHRPRESFVLSVGTLTPWKGHQFVIEALADVPAPRPRLVVAGAWGRVEDQLMALASGLGVELELRIGIPEAELLDLYRRAGVVACAQIREPFGLVVLEAMATAAPVVAVSEGGFLETVVPGRTGILVDRDTRAFGAAIAALLADRERAHGLGRAARAHVEENWSWDRSTDGLDGVLESCVCEAPVRT
jgi:glycosyltransferase involved in cell wall biosynthesis